MKMRKKYQLYGIKGVDMFYLKGTKKMEIHFVWKNWKKWQKKMKFLYPLIGALDCLKCNVKRICYIEDPKDLCVEE